MDREQLKATASELEQQLQASASLDDESRQALRDAARDIQAALDEGKRSELQRQSLAQRLSDAAEKFEGSHPALTDVITRLIDGLAQMGI
jgi:Domain of unknown function (DUF4404)